MLRREIEVEASELSESPLARDLGRILLVASVFSMTDALAHPKPFCSPQWRPGAKTHRFGPIFQKKGFVSQEVEPQNELRPLGFP